MKIKKSSKFAKILFCALAVSMLSSIGAVAAETYDSGEASHGMVGETIYQYRSALYASSSSKWRAATWIQAADGKNVPAGYMKAKAFLYDGAGNLCKSTVMQTNSTEANYFCIVAPGVIGTGDYYSRGEVSQYMGPAFSDSVQYTTLAAGTASKDDSAILKTLKATLSKDGSYPVNALGQTYGSGLLASVVGYKPDLIAAIGTGNVKGYVRTDELDPYTATPAEAVALEVSAKDSVLPLYDLNSKVVGTFVQDVGVSSNSREFAKLTVDAAGAKVAAGAYLTPGQTAMLPKTDAELIALAEKALTITPYSRNSKGQTYGSESMAGAVGYSPELIAVLATNELSGYVKKNEFSYAREHAQTDPSSRVIPVYDLNGKVVGEFKVEPGQSSNDPAFAGLSIEEAQKKLAAG
ncbi:hypothetical protein [Oscillibacter sp.]|uniref:hypothetical protein n=1 Tax=Oscillibacter sp. TaxID=1945593 RepID=UPI0028AC7104|nr:hypothetical protein [Oscillibacter sp.]